jgi:glycine oxidase
VSVPGSRRNAVPAADVVIVGAGIIGCALARRLASAGARVTVLERGDAGAEASSAAAGMLAPQAESDGPSPVVDLGVASRALYPGVVAALREETGIDPAYLDGGIVSIARSDQEAAVLERRRAWQAAAGHRVQALTAAEVRALAPMLKADVRAGLFFPDDHRIDNALLTEAYARACVRLGVTLRTGCPVTRVRIEGGRVVGVEAAGGLVRAGAVVNAAGAWAADIAAAAPIRVRPVRGQMVMLRCPEPSWPHAIYSHAVYLVPRRAGILLAGSTYEEAGFDKRVTGGAVADILARAAALVPALADATLVRTWAGLRPGTSDGLPILGADPETRGLYHATGHYRQGILLAPVTAERMSALILEGRTPPDIAPFAPERFAR